MPLYILDTDTISLFRKSHPLVYARALTVVPTDLSASVISAEEQLSGWYTFLRRASQPYVIEKAYHERAKTIRFYSRVQIIEFSLPAILRYQQLLTLKLNVRKNDLRIAAIALEAGAIVVTANVGDFTRVPGLVVEDWTVP